MLPILSRKRSLLYSLLAGWLAACAVLTTRVFVAALFNLGETELLSIDAERIYVRFPIAIAVATSGGITFFAALIRLGCYSMQCRSPLGLWARLRTGRWIIPGYDRIWLAPLAAIGAHAALFGASYAVGLPIEVAAFASTTIAMMIALDAPPSLAEWRLTGDYRMATQKPRRTA